VGDTYVGRAAGDRLPLNPALEGKSYLPVRYALDEEHVRAFAAAIGEDGSAVPPTIVTVPEILAGLDQVVADEELGIDFARVVHGDEEFVWHRPLRAGETLVAQTTVEGIRARGSLEFLTLRTDVRDEAGEPVAIARSTMIVRSDA
jgi:hypothetical protein